MPNTNLPTKAGNSLLRAALPKGLTFNKNTIFIVAISFTVILAFGFISAFAPKKKNETNNPANEDVKANNTIIADTLENFKIAIPNQQESAILEPPFLRPQDLPPGIAYPNNTFTGQYGNQTPEEQKRNEALSSPIRFATSTTPSSNENRTSFQTPIQQGIDPTQNLNFQGFDQQDQNMQDDKSKFLNSTKSGQFYASGGLMPPISKYEVKSGSIIPCSIITGINSDLPGVIVAQVRQHIFDTVSGRYLLIPQGSRIIGAYDSKIAYAQKRILVVWTRLLLPNGKSLNLEGMPGADLSGYAGLKDKVNNHYGKIIVGGIMTSLFGAGAKMVVDSTDPDDYGGVAASGAAENLANAGVKIFEKDLNVQPTLEVQPGLKFNVFVDKDLILEIYKTK